MACFFPSQHSEDTPVLTIKIESDDHSDAALYTESSKRKRTHFEYIEERASQELTRDGEEDSSCEYSPPPSSRYPDKQQQELPQKKKFRASPEVRTFPYRTLFSFATLATIEEAVKQGVNLLDTLSSILTKFNRTSYNNNFLLSQISELKLKAKPPRTIIGLVGNTGAGKSSIINALLEEEAILPTSCMEACTAVVTEISYNHQEDSMYRAEIEFHSKQEWENEVRDSVSEIIDAGVLEQRRGRGGKTDSEVAWAKLEAVYPGVFISTADFSDQNIESCLRNEAISTLLEKKRVIIQGNTATAFYDEIEKYIGSSQRETPIGDLNREKVICYWPLIKVVRLYIKADVLKTGAVLVDLPGSHDSNAARSNVGEAYMVDCSALWIVAPITRAVNDKTAKDLLGKTFKRQLFMDGGYHSTTFVCSKTDEISVTEVIKNLDVQEETDAFLKELKDIKQQRKDLLKRITDTKRFIKQLSRQLDNARNSKDIFDDLFMKAAAGETVFAPTTRKNARKTEISNAQITKRIGELKKCINTFKDEIDSLRKENSELVKQRQTLESDIRLSKKKCEIFCIESRNAFSKEALKRDFAAGLKQYEDETADTKDPENFDPSIPLRDYSEVENELPVFCVSARGYQKLCGRLQNESKANQFTEKHQTEIPQLKKHCMNATVSQRRPSALQFLAALEQFLGSTSLWCTSRARTMVGEGELGAIHAFIEGRLGDLERSLGELAQTIAQDMAENATTRIVQLFPEAATTAADEAVGRVTSQLHDKERSSPIHWHTLRAIYRKQGVHQSLHKISYNLNSTLCEPIMETITVPWGIFFVTGVETSFESLESTRGILSEAIVAIVSKFPELGLNVQQKQAFEEKIATLTTTIYDDFTNVTTGIITPTQRQISRSFESCIQIRMNPTYTALSRITGKGTLLGMRVGMERSLDVLRRSIFLETVSEGKEQLCELWQNVTEEMRKAGNKVVDSLRADLKAVGALCGGGEGEVSLAVLDLKNRILSYIGDANDRILELLKEDGHYEDGEDGELMHMEDADATVNYSSGSCYEKSDGSDSDGSDSEEDSDDDSSLDLDDSDIESLVGTNSYDGNDACGSSDLDQKNNSECRDYYAPVYEDDSEDF